MWCHGSYSCLQARLLKHAVLHVLQVAELAKLAKELQDLELPPPHVGDVFDFDDAPSALRKLQTGRTVGKVVLEVRDHS